jgi:hypothetical protein
MFRGGRDRPVASDEVPDLRGAVSQRNVTNPTAL